MKSLLSQVESKRRDGHRIVLTSGDFGLLRPGHLHTLDEAAATGDCLVVALHDDACIRRIEGPGRPILCQDDRATMLAGLESVDFVTVYDEEMPLELVRSLRPDVLFLGDAHTTDCAEVHQFVAAYGGGLVLR